MVGYGDAATYRVGRTTRVLRQSTYRSPPWLSRARRSVRLRWTIRPDCPREKTTRKKKKKITPTKRQFLPPLKKNGGGDDKTDARLSSARRPKGSFRPYREGVFVCLRTRSLFRRECLGARSLLCGSWVCLARLLARVCNV